MSNEPQQDAVGRVDDFPPGRFVIVQAGRWELGNTRLADGEFRAVRNACPHTGAPICRGIIGGTWPPSEPGELSYDRDGEVLVCPWHGYEYDLRTGTEMFQKTPTRLRLFPVTVRHGEVFVTV